MPRITGKIVFLLFSSFAFAADFTSFHDICQKGCANNPKEVALLQKFLNIEKDFAHRLKITGKYDNPTQKALIAFQKKYGLLPSGYVGILTKKQIQKVLNQKLITLSKAKKSNKKIDFLVKNQSTKINLPHQKETKKFSFANNKFEGYKAFRKKYSPKSYAIYKDKKLLALANKAKTLLKVDVSEQRIKLLVNGKVALDAPCTTGSSHKFEPNTKTYRDKHTPLGTFKIIEKIANKRSNIFGKIYKNGKLIFVGDRRKYKGSWKGAKFVGAPLFHWMRLTGSGIGLHASNHIKRYPGSNGCIRLPKNVAKVLFSKLKIGSTVKVVN